MTALMHILQLLPSGCIMAELLTGRPLFPGDDRKYLDTFNFRMSKQ